MPWSEEEKNIQIETINYSVLCHLSDLNVVKREFTETKANFNTTYTGCLFYFYLHWPKQKIKPTLPMRPSFWSIVLMFRNKVCNFESARRPFVTAAKKFYVPFRTSLKRSRLESQSAYIRDTRKPLASASFTDKKVFPRLSNNVFVMYMLTHLLLITPRWVMNS